MAAARVNLEAQLRVQIEAQGCVRLDDYFAQASAHYYAHAPSIGASGDFITAPEVSQIFGELIAACCIDYWQLMDTPAAFALTELGGGRGTLIADITRCAAKIAPDFIDASQIHIVETSPLLRSVQKASLAHLSDNKCTWHDTIATLPESCPLIIIANEFFDALPIRQFKRGQQGWFETYLCLKNGAFEFEFRPAQHIPCAIATQNNTPPDTLLEYSPLAFEMIDALAKRLHQQSGVMLIIDYGRDGGHGDTLQALYQHKPIHPLTHIGDADITAQVNFAHLADAARANGLALAPLMTQGTWLRTLGIETRGRHLIAQNPQHESDITRAIDRLINPAQMGDLFKIFACHAPTLPSPAGFTDARL